MSRFLLHTLSAVFALAVLVALPAQGQDSNEKTAMSKQTADIVQTAQNAGNFDTLVSALQAADLVSALQGDGPFTVFAPTDDAFAALPEGTLQNLLKPENKSKLQGILKYHVVQGKVMAKDVTKLSEAKTLEGSMIGIQTTNNAVKLTGDNEATVTSTDIAASNGVIHVIDSVLMPPQKMQTSDL